MNRSFGGSLDCNSINYNKGKSFRFSEWNSSTLYSNDDYIQDFVSYMGSMYACIQTNTAVEPTNELYWKLVVSGQPGIQGKQGNTGVTFTPHVDADGNLSWTNDGGLENPQTVNIRGPKGADSTVPGPKGEKGEDGVGLQGPQGRTGEMGIGLEFNWDGTKLGIKRTVDDEYTYVDLKGTTGSRGLKGNTGNTGPEGPQGPKGDSLYIQVSEPNEFGQRFLQKRYSESEAWVSFFDLSQMKGPKGDSIIVERNIETGNIEYRYQNQPSSANKILIYKDDIKGPKGDTIAKTYIADDGYLYIQLSGEDLPRRVGYVRGDRGADGREIVLRVYSGPSEDPNDPRIGTHLQWKYAGDEYKLWTNLIQINDLMNIALAGLKLEYITVSETDETGITTKYEVIELSHYQVEFDEDNNLVLTEKIANLSSVKVPTKTLLRDVKYNYDNNKLIFVFDTATGGETIEIDCDPFIRQGNGITISDGNIINVNVADESEKLADESDILVVDELGLRVRGIKDKLIKEFNLIKNDRDNNTHYYSYEYIAQDGTVYPIEIPDFVEWNNNIDQTRQIELRNNDKLVGLDVDTIIRNLIHLDGTDTVQVGDSKVSINLNGKEFNPTYNQQALALISNLEGEIKGLHLVKEDAPTDPDIAARYYLADKDGELLGDVHIDILKDNYLKEVIYDEDTYTFTFDFWVNDDPEEPAHDKIVTITLQKLFDNLKAIIDEVDSRLSNNIKSLNETIATINGEIDNEIRPAIEQNTADIAKLRTDLDYEITFRDEIREGFEEVVDKTDKFGQDLIDTNNNLAAEILRATNAESKIYDHIHEVEATIDGKIDETEKGQPNGVATLDENGFIPSTQINGQMAHVFGIDGVATAATLPDSANEGDIYYTTDTKKFYNYNGTSWDDPMDPKDDTIYNFRSCDATGDTSRTNILYRWDGQNLTEISESLALGEVTGTAYEGNKGAANRAAINSTPASLVSTLNISSDTSKVDINLETATKSGLNYNTVTSVVKNIPNATKLSAGIITSEEYTSLVETIPNKLVELETELGNIPEPGDYVTKEELEAKDYATNTDLTEGLATKQPVGDYALKSDLDNLVTKDELPSLDGYATETWVAEQGFLKAIPEEYITESELTAKDYATKSEIPDVSNLASKDEIPTKVSELENDSNFLTSIPDNYVTDTELQEAISGVQFELPVATDSVLGGIKVGAGLSITEDGILSATGGGVADSVNWENVIGRPTNLSQFTNDSGFITSDDLPDLSEYALKSDIPDLTGYALKSEIPTNVSSFTNDAGYITNSALTDYAKKSEIPDISGLATKSELSGYALKSHTHVVADITDFPEIPDISNLATKTELTAKQDTLVSGTNIKTINGTSLLGSGNLVIEAGGGSEIMDVLDNKTYARTQGSWVDLTDWLTWAELD